jgi:hypothetical protein
MLDLDAQLECEDEEVPATADTPSTVFILRQQFRDFAINKSPDPNLKRDLKPGFLLPYLLDFDALTYGRVRSDN